MTRREELIGIIKRLPKWFARTTDSQVLSRISELWPGAEEEWLFWVLRALNDTPESATLVDAILAAVAARELVELESE